MTNEHQPKIFDDYSVDCNDCQRYWNDQCDGVKPGSTRLCKEFLATRRTNILDQIEKLSQRLITLENHLLLMACGLAGLLIFCIVRTI